MITPEQLKREFDRAGSYDSYLQSATPDQRRSWDAFHTKVTLTSAQRSLLASFTREVKVLVLSGTWCGDCVQQVPMFDHIAKASNGRIDLRVGDRDVHAELSEAVKICGGRRVPTVIFMNEEFEFIGLYGDQVLSRFRAKAAKTLGASCPLPGADVPADEIAATIEEWIREFERAHLLVRLSAKLRQKHGD
jgi:thioredoxin-like negative regulator of GroEL